MKFGFLLASYLLATPPWFIDTNLFNVSAKKFPTFQSLREDEWNFSRNSHGLIDIDDWCKNKESGHIIGGLFISSPPLLYFWFSYNLYLNFFKFTLIIFWRKHISLWSCCLWALLFGSHSIQDSSSKCISLTNKRRTFLVASSVTIKNVSSLAFLFNNHSH